MKSKNNSLGPSTDSSVVLCCRLLLALFFFLPPFFIVLESRVKNEKRKQKRKMRRTSNSFCADFSSLLTFSPFMFRASCFLKEEQEGRARVKQARPSSPEQEAALGGSKKPLPEETLIGNLAYVAFFSCALSVFLFLHSFMIILVL